MNTKQHIKHSVLYFLKLTILIVALISLLYITGYSKVSADYYLSELLSRKSLLLFSALAVVAGFYPLLGFSKKIMEADIIDDKEVIIEAFQKANYSLTKCDDGEAMVFHASSIFKRLFMAFDDKITVTSIKKGEIIIEGSSKEVSQALFRIKAMVTNQEDE